MKYIFALAFSLQLLFAVEQPIGSDSTDKKYDSTVIDTAKAYIEDCYTNYNNFKEAAKSPLNFNEQIIEEVTPYFTNGGEIGVSNINARYNLLIKYWSYNSPFKNGRRDHKTFKVYFDMIYNKDTLKALFDENLISLEDAAAITKNNEEMAKYMLKVLKSNKAKLTAPNNRKKYTGLKSSIGTAKEKELALKESKDKNARYKKYIEVLKKVLYPDTQNNQNTPPQRVKRVTIKEAR